MEGKTDKEGTAKQIDDMLELRRTERQTYERELRRYGELLSASKKETQRLRDELEARRAGGGGLDAEGRESERDLLKELSATHGRELIDSLEEKWITNSKMSKPYLQSLSRCDRWDALKKEHADELYSVMINHELMIPAALFARLGSLVKDLYDMSSDDAPAWHLLNGRIMINADRLDAERGNVLMALCCCRGVSFTLLRQGVHNRSRKVIVNGYPFFSTFVSSERCA